MTVLISREARHVTFSPPDVRARVLMVPFATSAQLIETVLELGENQHHAWGVKEMLQAGVEVTVSVPTSNGLGRLGDDWSLPDTRGFDLIYSNHNRLVKTPIKSMFRRDQPPFVSLIYAGEPVLAPNRHFGLLCMTPRAVERFESLKHTRVRYAPWGVDPSSTLHQRISPDGDYVVSTGVTGRDFRTLMAGARIGGEPVKLAARGQAISGTSANVEVVSDFVGPWEIRALYEGAYAGIVCLTRDDRKRSSMGWTNVLEMMAIGLPIIKTRTGALDDIVDIEKIGAGILVEPEDPAQLGAAIRRLKESSELRASMAEAGAAYVREHLSMERFAEPLLELVFAARRASD
ncbi:MAG: glycosyltransferase family 4 protein [Gammaproteobacteria bacterium]|nr:glycosyltransferase family 4 protein [Gammaproteobacteria bacterium]